MNNLGLIYKINSISMVIIMIVSVFSFVYFAQGSEIEVVDLVSDEAEGVSEESDDGDGAESVDSEGIESDPSVSSSGSDSGEGDVEKEVESGSGEDLTGEVQEEISSGEEGEPGNETSGEKESEKKSGSPARNVDLVLYDNRGQKEIETEINEDEKVEIKVEKDVFENEGEWTKNVKVYSEEHFDRPLRVYTDIAEEDFSEMILVWVKEGKEISLLDDRDFDVKFYDTDKNGKDDRMSWIVPHLSEQNFKIILKFPSDNSSSFLDVQKVNVTSGVITSVTDLVFEFNISYVNISDVLCNFNISKSGTVVFERIDISVTEGEANITSEKPFSNGNYDWIFGCQDQVDSGISNSTSGSFEINLDYNYSASFSVNDTSIIEEEFVMFDIEIDAPFDQKIDYVIDYGDGENNGGNGSGSLDTEWVHKYDSEGEYTPVLNVSVDGGAWDVYHLDSPGKIVVEEKEPDAGKPEVALKNPANGAVINEESINFSYGVSGDVTVENCTLDIYFYNGSTVAEIVYSNTKDISKTQDNVTYLMKDFDEGDYYWEVGCLDSSGLKGEASRTFEISYPGGTFIAKSNDSDVQKVNELVDYINDFLDEYDGYDISEREVIDSLGIMEELDLLKRKLLQMRSDLQTKAVLGDATVREKRLNEIRSEIESAAEVIPVSVSVKESSEFSKSKMSNDLEEIVADYVEAKKMKLDRKAISSLVETNNDMQSLIKVNSKAKKVEIEYLEGERKMTLVIKEVAIEEDDFDMILEIIPEELEEAKFLNKNSKVSDGIYEVKVSDLAEDKVIYYFEEHVDLKKLEESDSIAFTEETGKRSNSITAFAIFEDFGGSKGFVFYFSWLFFLMIAIAGGVYGMRTFQSRKISMNSEAAKILSLIKEIKTCLEYNDLIRAKNHYSTISSIYNMLPYNVRDGIYPKIKEAKLMIDKKDISSVVKEYLEAIRTGRREDAALLYKNIQSLYPAMPEKYKAKVHERIAPTLGMIRGFNM